MNSVARKSAVASIERKANSRTFVGKSLVTLLLLGLSTVIFWIPFYFVIVNSFKSSSKAADMTMSWPDTFHMIDNYSAVLLASDSMLIRAFYNSTLLTVLSLAGLVFVSSLAGFVLQRRENTRGAAGLNFLVLAGLMIPPAVVPTIWVLNSVGLFKTLPGLTLVEIALHFPFCAILYKAFTATIPRDIDESAFIDGCGGFKLFTQIIFPLLKPVSSTIIIIQSVSIFNDFVNPLYFLPGAENATVQLTLYNFMSMYMTQWNLLFADVVLISLPPLVLFLFFNKRIVAGMTAGAVKG
ncbi:carbohydrate ABC transporter permease [Paenibacillus sp. GCM10023248]|uniref:carbohydrate ABC transporter permease n=1 Tax=Bacillales TaxID=1385 RepID=UPI002379AB06|nr:MULTISPECIES: carbohydrate ABC transporter permease [Bacillales]MDD9268380.1 carbohydrate ABC transporter permease [Paenibacillus sp. MAHUQ-63]MDR6879270.1 raffinose/stachyose/melibiose transport system permease protein [Bacillus sp. 3255]